MHDILKRKYFLKDLKDENEAKKILQKQAPQWTVLSSGSVTQTMTELCLCFWDADNPNSGLPVLAENSPNTYPNPKNTRSEALKSSEIPQDELENSNNTFLLIPRAFYTITDFILEW